MYKSQSYFVNFLICSFYKMGALLLITILGVGAVFAHASQSQPQMRITLAQAEHMALKHNRTLRADFTLIEQSKANQITAGLRPNPVFETDALFLPVFSPHNFTSDTLNNFSEFDAGLSYTFELHGKRKARMKAAQAATHVTTDEVKNDERILEYMVARQFISVLYEKSKLHFAKEALANFNKSLAISQRQYKAGSISHGNLLKIKLERLLFQRDVKSAQVAEVQAKNQLRQLVGFSALPQNYDVIGKLKAKEPHRGLLDLEAEALRLRPDLKAARQNVTAARKQLHLAKANAVPDLNTTLDYTHLGGLNNLSAYAAIPIPIFNRNQGNIARTSAQIIQAQDQKQAADELVLTQVRSAYADQQSAMQVVNLYRTGYLQEATQSLQISAYAYLHGATSLLSFLDAERSYRRVELNYRRALAQAMLSKQRVQDVVGAQGQPGRVHHP